jgi:hypothetical protein
VLIESSFVVVSALCYLDGVVSDPVHEAVFMIDAPGSEPRPVATELLRFADALVAAASDVAGALSDFKAPHRVVTGLVVERRSPRLTAGSGPGWSPP